VLAAGALAAVTLVAFVLWQRRVKDPLLDVRLFENPRFTAASSTIMVLFFATSSGYGLLAVALFFMGTGMGLAGAQATEAIMGSLPPERANIGSAVQRHDA